MEPIGEGTTEGLTRIRGLLRLLEQAAHGDIGDAPEPLHGSEPAQTRAGRDTTNGFFSPPAAEEATAGEEFPMGDHYEPVTIIVPVRFGELVPRTQLFRGEIVRLDGPDRKNATTLRVRSRAAAIWIAYLAGGSIVTGSALLAIFYAHGRQGFAQSLESPPAVVADDHAAVHTESSGKILVTDGAMRSQAISIDEATLANPAVTYVWLRNVPDGAVVSQGLIFSNGSWLLSKAQMSNLVIKVPPYVPNTHIIWIDIAGADNMLIKQISLRLSDAASNPLPAR